MNITRPNILLIHWHDLGRHLGCYDRQVSSPCLDALARSGVLFRHSHATAPLCSPSRSSLFTGRYPHANGIMGLTHGKFPWHYHPGERTLAHLLSDAGYHTALFGLQHESKDATTLGYTECTEYGGQPACGPVTDGMIDFLRGRAGNRQPFFASVGFFEVHRWGKNGYPADKYTPVDPACVHVPSHLPDMPAVRAELAAFQGAIAYADACVGRVLAALAESGLEQNTWVIFTTDHGIAFPRAKSTLYDPGTETALLMRWPAGFPGGRNADCLVSHVDFVPTVLDALKLPTTGAIQGRSYWGWLAGAAYTPRTEVFSEKTYHDGYDPCRAIRTSRWKYIRNFEIRCGYGTAGDIRSSVAWPILVVGDAALRPMEELYDLDADPGELVNLGADPRLDSVRRNLAARLDEWMRMTYDPILKGPIGETLLA